jgi:hypothetical protein
MTYRQPAPTTTRRIPRLVVAGLLAFSATIGAALGYRLQAASSEAAASPIDAPRSERPGVAPPGPDRSRQPPERPPGPPAPGGAAPRDRPQRGGAGGGASEADGVVPDGTTILEDEIPGVARLNPALRSVLRRAATDAARDGVQLYVTSGWRSSKYQEQLLQDAISQYGSEREAARWVGTPAASAHVSGDAVDIGPADATAWLSRHGATYGLCQIYRNEPWHFELRAEAIKHRCPPMYADPTRDPRMRQ